MITQTSSGVVDRATRNGLRLVVDVTDAQRAFPYSVRDAAALPRSLPSRRVRSALIPREDFSFVRLPEVQIQSRGVTLSSLAPRKFCFF
jgi:hypothetical protein